MEKRNISDLPLMTSLRELVREYYVEEHHVSEYIKWEYRGVRQELATRGIVGDVFNEIMKYLPFNYEDHVKHVAFKVNAENILDIPIMLYPKLFFCFDASAYFITLYTTDNHIIVFHYENFERIITRPLITIQNAIDCIKVYNRDQLPKILKKYKIINSATIGFIQRSLGEDW